MVHMPPAGLAGPAPIGRVGPPVRRPRELAWTVGGARLASGAFRPARVAPPRLASNLPPHSQSVRWVGGVAMTAARTLDGRHVSGPENQPRSRPRHEPGRRPPADHPTDGDDGPNWPAIAVAGAGPVAVLGVGWWWIVAVDGGGRLGDEVRVPVAPAYAAGEEAFMLHPTVSDATFADAVAETLDGAPALVQPSLADMPAEATTEVCVFTNGPKGAGWLGRPLRPFRRRPPVAARHRPRHLERRRNRVRADQLRAGDRRRGRRGSVHRTHRRHRKPPRVAVARPPGMTGQCRLWPAAGPSQVCVSAPPPRDSYPHTGRHGRSERGSALRSPSMAPAAPRLAPTACHGASRQPPRLRHERAATPSPTGRRGSRHRAMSPAGVADSLCALVANRVGRRAGCAGGPGGDHRGGGRRLAQTAAGEPLRSRRHARSPVAAGQPALRQRRLAAGGSRQHPGAGRGREPSQPHRRHHPPGEPTLRPRPRALTRRWHRPTPDT